MRANSKLVIWWWKLFKVEKHTYIWTPSKNEWFLMLFHLYFFCYHKHQCKYTKNSLVALRWWGHIVFVLSNPISCRFIICYYNNFTRLCWLGFCNTKFFSSFPHHLGKMAWNNKIKLLLTLVRKKLLSVEKSMVTI